MGSEERRAIDASSERRMSLQEAARLHSERTMEPNTSAMISQERIVDVLHRWQFRLGLTDWQIAVDFDDSTPSANGHLCHMKIHRSTYYKRASLTVGIGSLDPSKLPDSIELDLMKNNIVSHEQYVEISIAHELLHLIARDLVCVMEMVEEQLHPSVRGMLHEAQTRAEEQMVEQLAEALVTNWPNDD